MPAYRQQHPAQQALVTTPNAQTAFVLLTSLLPVPRVVLAHGCCGSCCPERACRRVAAAAAPAALEGGAGGLPPLPRRAGLGGRLVSEPRRGPQAAQLLRVVSLVSCRRLRVTGERLAVLLLPWSSLGQLSATPWGVGKATIPHACCMELTWLLELKPSGRTHTPIKRAQLLIAAAGGRLPVEKLVLLATAPLPGDPTAAKTRSERQPPAAERCSQPPLQWQPRRRRRRRRLRGRRRALSACCGPPSRRAWRSASPTQVGSGAAGLYSVHAWFTSPRCIALCNHSPPPFAQAPRRCTLWQPLMRWAAACAPCWACTRRCAAARQVRCLGLGAGRAAQDASQPG